MLFVRRHRGCKAALALTKPEMPGSKRRGCRRSLREIRQHLKREMGGGYREKEELSMRNRTRNAKNRTRNAAESRKAGVAPALQRRIQGEVLP